MGVYDLRDLDSSISGDINLNSQGDLQLASAQDTMFNILNFWVRTDHGGYAAKYSVGCDLGSFIGETNTEDTLEDMESQTTDVLVRNVIFPEDLRVRAVPFSEEEALVAIEMKGSFIDENGAVETPAPKIVTYTYPYIAGSPDPIVEL